MRDLFVIHATDDAAFARGYLVPALGLTPERALLSSELPTGMSLVQAIEQGVTDSRVTVVVLSPAFLHDDWALFGETLASHHAVTGGAVVPLLLVDCAVPLRLDFRVKLDCRAADGRDAEVARLRALLELPAPVEREIPCPYPGMRPFSAENAGLFCGRDREIDELVRLVAGGCRETYVLGPSGSGKSSLLLSGVAPRLARAGDPVIGAPFAVRVLRPGGDPVGRLAAAVPAAPTDDAGPPPRTLLVIDQLEEIFTLAGLEARRAFIAALEPLRARADLHLVLLLRADFMGALMQSELWPRARVGQRVEIDPLRGPALRDAITVPAQRVGVDLEPALIDRLLTDAADEPGALPLIQETLVHLWARRDHNVLTAEAYAALGSDDASGLAVALARHADAAFTALDEDGQGVARRLFLRLISFGEGRADARRQQKLASLQSGEDVGRLTSVVQHLVARRLLIVDGDPASGEVQVDLAHEALLAAWPRLRAWTAKHRDDERRRRALEAKAVEWVGLGRGPSGQLDTGELAEVATWLDAETARDLAVGGDLAALIAASRATATATHRRRRRGLAFAFTALAVVIATVSTLGLIARRNAREATRSANEAKQNAEAAKQNAEAASRNADEARAQEATANRRLGDFYMEQGRVALIEQHRPFVAISYLTAARERGVDNAALRLLFHRATRGLWEVEVDHGDAIKASAWSPDGSRFMTSSGTHARVWDATTGRPITPPIEQRSITFAAFSPDGTSLLTCDVGGTVHLRAASTGASVTTFSAHDGLAALASFAAWSADGRWVATASGATVRLWEASSGAPRAAPLIHESEVRAVVFSPDASRIATATAAEVQVWDAASGDRIGRPLATSPSVALRFHADGQRVLVIDKTSARLWEPAGGASQPMTLPGLVPNVMAASFSRDGSHLVIDSDRDDVRVWELATGRSAITATRYDVIRALALSPDGARTAINGGLYPHGVWTGVFESATGRELQRIVHEDDVVGVGFSPDGARLLVASAGRARIWRVVEAPSAVPLANRDPVTACAFSPDGKRVAVGTAAGTARLWDGATGQAIAPAFMHDDVVTSVAFDSRGARLVTASGDRTARVWDVATGKPALRPLVLPSAVRSAELSPDGALVLTVGAYYARVWDASTGEPIAPALAAANDHFGDGEIVSANFSPDGLHMMVAHRNAVRIWDTRTWQARALLREPSRFLSVATFSPDGGKVLIATSDSPYDGDSTVQSWDARTGGELWRVPASSHVLSAAFSPDGSQFVIGGTKGSGVFETATGRRLATPAPISDRTSHVAFSADGRLVLAKTANYIRMWDAVTGQVLVPETPSMDGLGARPCAAFSPDGTKVVAAGEQRTGELWDLSRDGRPLAAWQAIADAFGAWTPAR